MIVAGKADGVQRTLIVVITFNIEASIIFGWM